MKIEADRLGITMHRVVSVTTCVCLFSFATWGGLTAYNNIKIVECGKGDVAIKLPDPAKQVIVAAGLSPCDCEK